MRERVEALTLEEDSAEEDVMREDAEPELRTPRNQAGAEVVLWTEGATRAAQSDRKALGESTGGGKEQEEKVRQWEVEFQRR